MNYQLLLDMEIEKNIKLGKRPKLLLHACCAPCSSYVLEYLSSYFDITVFYYNPNISLKEEFDRRCLEVNRLIKELKTPYPVKFIEADYNYAEFENISVGLEKEKEGGARCVKCYFLRLEKTAQYASEFAFDYFTTTLSISPYKNSKKLNEIGECLEKKYGVKYLYSDFKKKNGYKRSIELSKQYNLYRQDYCGCIYSKIEREEYLKKRDGIDENRSN